MRSNGDAVGNGSGLQVIQAGTGFQVQIGVLRVGNQQAASFQHPHDAAAEGVEQVVQFFADRPAGAVKGRPITGKGVGAVQEQHVQVAAGLFDFLDEAWVVFSKDGVESGLFRAVPVVSGNSGGNGSKKHRT